VKLIRHVDVVVGIEFVWFGGLTGFTWNEISTKMTISRSGHGKNKNNSRSPSGMTTRKTKARAVQEIKARVNCLHEVAP
jgi:hypothetical protein